MSKEIIQEWVDIYMARDGKIVTPREVKELARDSLIYKVYDWLCDKARHTPGYEPYKQGPRKGQLYLQRGELIASIRRIAKRFHKSPSQTYAAVDFLVDHCFIEQRTEQQITITNICNYDRNTSLNNNEPNSKPNSSRTDIEQLPDGSYIISIGYKELTNYVTNDVTKEGESPSPKVESLTPEPLSSKEKIKEPKPPDLSPEDFISSLKENPAYSWIDIEVEVGKMKAWLQTPKGSHRRFTKKFILNWLNKMEKPFETMEAPNMNRPPSIENPFPNYRAQDPMGGSTRKDVPEDLLRSDDPAAAKKAQKIVQGLTERKTERSVYWPKFKSESEPIQREPMTEEAKKLRKAELRRQAEVLKKE